MPPGCWRDPLLPAPADGAGATPEQMLCVQLPAIMPFILSGGFLLDNTARESYRSEVDERVMQGWEERGEPRTQLVLDKRSPTWAPTYCPSATGGVNCSAAAVPLLQQSPLGIFSFLHGAPNNWWSGGASQLSILERAFCSALSYLIILLGFYPKK